MNYILHVDCGPIETGANHMHRVLLLGAGKIGRMIAQLLSSCGDYEVTIGDASSTALERFAGNPSLHTMQIDASNENELRAAMLDQHSVISALSFHFNPVVAKVAVESGVNYFDLTEDVETTRHVQRLSEEVQADRIVMPQCGLAPGFISIVANQLTKQFETVDTVHMRVGALPQFPSNALKYNLTWSTDGLVNEYCNPCEAIHGTRRVEVLPLEGLEHFSLDGVRYEAFNTSGGLGTLCDTLEGRVRELNYKTIRYIGHRDLAAFLINELQLGHHRETLKQILERAIPVTFQDVVVIFCTVTGQRNQQLVQISDARKIYSETINDEAWSAIQLTTASSVCAALDLMVEGKLPRQGFVRQEQIDLEDFNKNRFGKRFVTDAATRYSKPHTHDKGSE
ncbi:saccharopine dehydrogenase family protein [Aporhodopirellula aestuarii]|uniref:Saccharopine dehydrogenase NADP-binding domain-containing protein n=1 Tax=Aporhodopirellula aestuarii TaxID=2950107 RepID=A0ABT0U5C6_9BACT|nr:saccharopine dehydrogenase C-terminal domain-containing protein [Aporhodopirellula aestuarii]MCM2372118.1 saccharopine dehydrogenase NADP-binding domain-containing protein [Aporhodopirellula aestuarii]